MRTRKLKAFCAACASVLTLSIAPAFSASAAGDFTYRSMGDIDGNGEVSVDDAQSVLLAYVKSVADCEALPASANPPADTNLDGVIDILDASNILRYYCRTLVGDKPMWSEYRAVSEKTGTEEMVCKLVDYRMPDGTTLQINVPTGETAFATYGKTGMFIEVGVASGKAGDYVSIPVYVSGCPDIAGFQFYLNRSGDAQLKGIQSNIDEILGDPLPSDPVWNPDPEWGALVWCSARGENLRMENGTVIGEYIYQIPEDAKSGDVYSLTIDKDETLFVSTGEEMGKGFLVGSDANACSYQFTLLDGAIVVE